MIDNISDNREIAIRLTGVKKQYRLGTIGGQTLQRELQSWWARKRGKEDPNARIGQDQRLIGQEFMALNGIDLTVYRGERLGIIGANGAGKSTLLKLLSRVTAPTEGEIDIWGRVSSMLEVGTGFHGEMTGRENIYMNGAILGMTTSEIDERLDDIIEFSEVREFIDTPVKRYSSGMFVKLAFSVAAHLNSEIMIMDEVLAVGDMAFQKKCLDKMRQAADQEDRTILYVSHNMNTIRTLCDRCIVLDEGKLIFDGDVEEAIAVYMNRSLEENEVDMDLSAKSHTPGKGIDTGIFMERLELLDGTEYLNDSEPAADKKDKADVSYAHTEAALPATDSSVTECKEYRSTDVLHKKSEVIETSDSNNIIKNNGKLHCKITPVYEPGENLLMRLTVNVTRPMKNMKVRLTIRTDADVGIGTAWSETMDFSETGRQQVVLNFPLNQLQKGTFYVSIGFYEAMELGWTRSLDHITRAFRIELVGIPTWYANAYGYVKLDDGQVVN